MTSPVKTQGMNVGEFLLSEAEGQRSRETRVAAFTTGTAWPSGTVMGKVTTGGKLIKYLDGASDGSQTAMAVMLTDIPASAASGDIPVVTYERDCEVIGAILNGGAGVDAAGKVDLTAAGIIVR